MPQRRGTRDAVRIHDRAGIVLGSVDAVGVAGKRRDALGAVERHGERQQELDVAPAAALALDGDGGLAARQQHRRRRHRPVADAELAGAQLAGDRGMDQGHIARLALDPVAQHDRRDVLPQRRPRRRRASDSCGLAISSNRVRCEDRVVGFRRLVDPAPRDARRPPPARQCRISPAPPGHRRKSSGQAPSAPRR